MNAQMSCPAVTAHAIVMNTSPERNGRIAPIFPAAMAPPGRRTKPDSIKPPDRQSAVAHGKGLPNGMIICRVPFAFAMLNHATTHNGIRQSNHVGTAEPVYSQTGSAGMPSGHIERSIAIVIGLVGTFL